MLICTVASNARLSDACNIKRTYIRILLLQQQGVNNQKQKPGCADECVHLLLLQKTKAMGRFELLTREGIAYRQSYE